MTVPFGNSCKLPLPCVGHCVQSAYDEKLSFDPSAVLDRGRSECRNGGAHPRRDRGAHRRRHSSAHQLQLGPRLLAQPQVRILEWAARLLARRERQTRLCRRELAEPPSPQKSRKVQSDELIAG
jgi:hypothetical protein